MIVQELFGVQHISVLAPVAFTNDGREVFTGIDTYAHVAVTVFVFR